MQRIQKLVASLKGVVMMSNRMAGVVVAWVILGCLGVVLAVQEEKKVALPVTLPKALFEGTPTGIQGVRLDPINKARKRGDFMVPSGTVLLSSNKTVTASDPATLTGTLDQVTDGDKEGVDGSFMALGPGTQWVQIDLGAAVSMSAIVVWHYHKMARVYRDVVVQVADDPDFVTNVRTLFNNDSDNSSGLGVGKDYEYIETNEGKLIDGKGEKGRYVRLYSKENTADGANHYIEVEVYGKPAAR